jgi:hypothetical protein
MSDHLDEYHRLIGYLRAKGLDEAQAYRQAEELMTHYEGDLINGHPGQSESDH